MYVLILLPFEWRKNYWQIYKKIILRRSKLLKICGVHVISALYLFSSANKITMRTEDANAFELQQLRDSLQTLSIFIKIISNLVAIRSNLVKSIILIVLPLRKQVMIEVCQSISYRKQNTHNHQKHFLQVLTFAEVMVSIDCPQ